MTSDNPRADLAAIADGLSVEQYADTIWLRRDRGRVTVSTGKWPIIRAGDGPVVVSVAGMVDVTRLPAKLRRS